MKGKLSFTIVVFLALHSFGFAQDRVRTATPTPVAPRPTAVNTAMPAVAELITQLPAELPQKVSGLAFDGEKFWFAIYRGGGRYATFDPRSMDWKVDARDKRHNAIAKAAGGLGGPGGICFVGDKLWVAGSGADSLGYIDTRNWKVERVFNWKPHAVRESLAYSSLACDGSHLWVVWHWFNYELPVTQTQLLRKLNPESGEVLAEYPAPGGSAADAAHGLTWDGSRLWYMKDSKLSAIDPSTGTVTTQYMVEQIKRPSGLAWDGVSLWVVEFGGSVWRLRL